MDNISIAVIDAAYNNGYGESGGWPEPWFTTGDNLFDGGKGWQAEALLGISTV